MKNDKRRLVLASGFLGVLLLGMAIRPLFNPPAVQAQPRSSDLYIEPGTAVVRPLNGAGEMQGKVVIDKETGDIWGFPTSTSAPYPVDPTTTKPPVSEPVYLGKFDFGAMRRP